MANLQAKTLVEYVDPTPRQREFIQAWRTHRFTLFGGAAGPGKSYILRWSLPLYLIWLFAVKRVEKARVALFCEDYPSLQDRQISKIEVEFPAWLGKLRRGETKEFVLNPEYGGGVILLRNLDDPSKYLSTEFAGVAVDELTRNKLQTFNDLRLRLRWPGVERPIFLAATNPGGIGHVWVKKYWLDKKFPAELEDDANEFAFVRALPTDNPHLTQQYWRDLGTLPEHMRRAYLEGDWNLLAGQYFGQFGEQHCIEEDEVKLQPWWPKWISGDWGYQHPACIHWHARRDDGIVLTYRELYGSNIGEVELGQAISDNTGRDECILHFFLSPDAFAKRGSENTIAEQINEGLERIPQPTPADNDRIGGARLMHQLLQANQWLVSTACPKLIECLPTLLHDEENMEDVLKVDWTLGQIGDDPYDSARYGLKSYLSPGTKPLHVQIEEQVQSLQKQGHLQDRTNEMMFRKTLEIRAKQKQLGGRFAYRGLHH